MVGGGGGGGGGVWGGVQKFLSFFWSSWSLGVALFLSTDINTQDRLDKSRSAEKQKRD